MGKLSQNGIRKALERVNAELLEECAHGELRAVAVCGRVPR